MLKHVHVLWGYDVVITGRDPESGDSVYQSSTLAEDEASAA